MYHVLLYYKLIDIPNPEAQVTLHKEICSALQLKGRILIGTYGINGTVGGSKESIEMYKSYMNQHRLFKQIDFKESVSEFNPFPRLRVKHREEIITTGAMDHLDLCRRGKHISRDKFHEWLKRGEDMVILDMRNDYEWEIGRFVNSVRPPMKYFRDLKDNIEFYEQFKDKKIVMFCTGGIRCEPASAYFIEKGFDPQNIYQLEGGIVKYAEKYGNEGYYEGKCFVFDDRISVPVDTRPEAVVVGNCLHCQKNVDTYRNCSNKFCNKLFIACADCNTAFENTCSVECRVVAQDEANVRPTRGNYVKVVHRNKL